MAGILDFFGTGYQTGALGGMGPATPEQYGLLQQKNLAANNYGLLNLGLNMLANSGYSATPRSVGQITGASGLAALQARNEYLNQERNYGLDREKLDLLKQKYSDPSEHVKNLYTDTALLAPIIEKTKRNEPLTPQESALMLRLGGYGTGMDSQTGTGIVYPKIPTTPSPSDISNGGAAPSVIPSPVAGLPPLTPRQQIIANNKAAEKIGSGEITDREKQNTGRQQISDMVKDVSDKITELEKMGGMVSSSNSAGQNVKAYLKNTTPGQFAQKLIGTDEQRIRNDIENAKPALINAVRQATGMGAKAMDSNTELEFYSRTTPNLTQDAKNAIQQLMRMNSLYGIVDPKTNKPNEVTAPSTPAAQGWEEYFK